MAKRGAEALACHAPWETFASHRPSKRGRSEPGLREPSCGKTPWSGGCKKRKRAEEDEETSGKRPTALKRGEPLEERVLLASTGGWEETRAQEESGLLSEAGSGEAPAHPWSPKVAMVEEDSQHTELNHCIFRLSPDNHGMREVFILSCFSCEDFYQVFPDRA